MTDKTLSNFIEYSQLFWLNLKVKAINFIDYLKVMGKYYSVPTFFKVDTYLIFSYLFNNPFGVHKRFLLSKGELDVYTYGETPLATLDFISKQCRLSLTDTVYELGCGRGRTCFWLNQFVGCSVIGIDYVTPFIQRAKEVSDKFQIQSVQFREEDFTQSDLSDATVIYLYGTCYSAPFIESLTHHLSKVKKGTKIISVSYALTDYVPKAPFEVMRRFPAHFTWGTGDVYLQVKK